jgi:hypothetical protein
MCITADRGGQTDTKHVKAFPRNVCSRTLIAFEFQSDHPQHQKWETFFVSTPYLRQNFLTPTFWYFILVPPITTAIELVTKQIFWRFVWHFYFALTNIRVFNLRTEACATFCLYFVCAFCSQGKFNYIVTNIIRERFLKLVSREQSPESKCVEGVTVENEMRTHRGLKN